jgi:GH18 family chitinase
MQPGRLLLSCGICLVACLCAGAADAPAPRASFRIAGYLPEYRAAAFDLAAATPLTDLIVFSAQPTPAGELDLSRLKRVPWSKLRAFKTRQRVRLILCVGGWQRSGGFPAVASSAEKRQAFAKSAVRVCLEQRLDGLDLDWEHPKDEAEQRGYGQLLADLRAAFDPHGLVLSVTLAAWQKLPGEAFAAVDWVQVMAYDHEGRHSTFDAARADVKSLLDRGVPAEKIVLGIPLYGRDLKKRDRALTYREIVTRHRPEPAVDEIDGVYFNGPATIRRKTTFALESRLGGVMVWEMGQDAGGEQSLLRTIRATVPFSR